MMSCEDFSLDLNANYFLYSLTIGGVGCNVDVLEKSDKVKIKVLHFVSMILTSCIVNVRLARDRLTVT